MKHFFSIILIAAFILGSCVRARTNIDPNRPSNKPVEDIEAGFGFDWKTTKNIEISIKGIPSSPSFSETLRLLDNKNTEYYVGSYDISTNLVVVLEVPVGMDQVILSYGELSEILGVVDDKSIYEFVTEIDNGSDDE